jgi:N-acetylglutamate synthase-like GNAT family acetyltransferase
VLLRSVVVVSELRGSGHGKDITGMLLALARQAGAERAYLLTTTASEFFARLGFAAAIRAEVPETIRSTYQAATICSTAAMLTRSTAQ